MASGSDLARELLRDLCASAPTVSGPLTLDTLPYVGSGWVGLRPGHDVLRVVDDRAVVEHERRDLVVAGQPLDFTAPAEETIGTKAPVCPDDVRLVAGGSQRLVCLRASVALIRAERAVADIELYRGIVTSSLS